MVNPLDCRPERQPYRIHQKPNRSNATKIRIITLQSIVQFPPAFQCPILVYAYSSRHHGLRTIAMPVKLLAIEPEVQPVGQILPCAPRRVLGPSAYLDKLSDGCLAAFGLTEDNSLVDLVGDVPPQIRVQNGLLFWS